MSFLKCCLLFLIVAVSTQAFSAPGDLIKIESVLSQGPNISKMLRFKMCPAASRLAKDLGFHGYRLTFMTTTVHGTEVPTQGLLLVPDYIFPMPIFVYQHGTVFSREELPSQFKRTNLSEVTAISNCFTTGGYITVMADYLGFGDGTGVHPYLHAESEAWVARDMMRATKAALARLKVKTTSKLFVGGYSQGGQAAMSLLRLLETDPQREFAVTAGAPMAGPYDLPGTMPVVLNAPTKNSAAEVAYILAGLNPIYGFYRNLIEVIRPEHAASFISMFDGTKSWKDILQKFNMKPEELLQPHFIQANLGNPHSVFWQAMHHNEVYQWFPSFPMRLYHARGDKDVPFVNSEIAQQYFRDQGASVDLIDLGNFGHVAAAPHAFGLALMWFESLR